MSNPYPILGEYNYTNLNGVRPLINYDNLNEIRGTGNYNPAPLKIQTTDRGNAFSNIDYNNVSNNIYSPVTGELYVNPNGSVDVHGTWESNTNYNLKTETGDNYEYYDEYQRWALNAIRKSDPYILPFLFSKINVKFIQDSVVNHVKKERNIEINTRQDVDNLLNLMLSTYTLMHNSNGVYANNLCSTESNDNKSCDQRSILAKMNKYIIESYVQSVLSGLNMNEYYQKDISQLPIPLTRPVSSNNKGSKVLGWQGPFEDNHAFTKNISSFNIRNTMPGKLNKITFGN
jgi:hypothetical protein